MTNVRFLADENFNGNLLDGLRTILPDVDILRVQDTDHVGTPDPELLAWAAEQGRILLTHDVQTIVGYAYDRVRSGLPMPGVIEVRIVHSLGKTIDDLVLMIEASDPDEFEHQVRYIPIR